MDSYHNRKIQIGIIAAPSTRYWNGPHVLVTFFSEGRSPPAYYTKGRGYYLTVVGEVVPKRNQTEVLPLQRIRMGMLLLELKPRRYHVAMLVPIFLLYCL